MRRFSQRNSLVTLSDINITPLLDLAFVLLIIFVIISPQITASREQGMKLNLPRAGGSDRQLDPKDLRSVYVDPRGAGYQYNGRRLSLDEIERELVREYQANPNLIVKIYTDRDGRIEDFMQVLDRCTKNGITRMQFPTEPPTKR